MEFFGELAQAGTGKTFPDAAAQHAGRIDNLVGVEERIPLPAPVT
jgi:hypothetical protein